MDIENLTETVARISALLPDSYTYEADDGVGRWTRGFDDGTAAWVALNFGTGEIAVATMDFEPDDLDGKWIHRDVEQLPELAAVCLRMLYLGRSVTVAGSEFISTREDREELEKSLDNRPAELEALKKSFH